MSGLRPHFVPQGEYQLALADPAYAGIILAPGVNALAYLGVGADGTHLVVDDERRTTAIARILNSQAHLIKELVLRGYPPAVPGTVIQGQLSTGSGLRFLAHDLPVYRGVELTEVPFAERFALLQQLQRELRAQGQWHPSWTLAELQLGEVKQDWPLTRATGPSTTRQQLLLKRLDGRYRRGAPDDWMLLR